jgi:hypothetical protein
MAKMKGNSFSDIITKVPSGGKKAKRGMKRMMKRKGRR